MDAQWTLLGIAVALATVVACGGKANEHSGSETSGNAGRDAMPEAGGTDIGGTSGSGGTALSGSGGAAGSGGSGGSPEQDPFGLIIGDDACPSSAPLASGCAEDGMSCVYRGVESGLSRIGTAHCVCMAGSWACVNSDENGDTKCPPVKPSPEDACPAGGLLNCQYPLLGHNAIASCWCKGEGAVWGTCGL